MVTTPPRLDHARRGHARALVVVLATMSLVLLAASGAVAVPACCTPRGDDLPRPVGDDPRALLLLQRTVESPSRTSYSGTRLTTVWTADGATSVLVDVQHVAGQGTLLTARGGDDAGTTTFLASEATDRPRIGDLDITSLELLTAAYDVSLVGTGAVAGRRAGVVEVGRAGRAVARVWIDQESGVLLRRELLDRSGRLVAESAFIDLDVDGDVFIDHLPPSPPGPATQPVSVRAHEHLQTAGWDCRLRVGPLQLVDIEQLAGADAIHLSYSDGLFGVSLFEQHGSLDAEAMVGFSAVQLGGTTAWVRAGVPSYAVWEGDGIVYTAVSDAPPDMLTQLVATSTPPAADEPGFWGRVGAGLARMSGWVSPVR